MSTSNDPWLRLHRQGHSAPELGYWGRDECKATPSRNPSQRGSKTRRAKSAGTPRLSEADNPFRKGTSQQNRSGEETDDGQEDVGPATRHLEDPSLGRTRGGNECDTALGRCMHGSNGKVYLEDSVKPNANRIYSQRILRPRKYHGVILSSST